MAEPNKHANSITLWNFPVGEWDREARFRPLLDAFTAETGIEVRTEQLNYDTGDRRLRAVLGTEAAPDLILEGPQRIVADWGAAGAMEDLSGILDPGDRKEIYRSVLSACTAPDGAVYLYPLVRTVHCMAINVDAFRAANALQYVDLKRHTWTTDQFKQAVTALSAYYGNAVGTVYCGGQGGDQGTRALITNLHGGPFVDAQHTRYTWDDPRIISALQELHDLPGLYYDPYLTGGDEIKLFHEGKLKLAFCWSVSKQLHPGSAQVDMDRTVKGEEITFMSFPAPGGKAKLYQGVWGFGVCRRQDPARLAAAKAFIRFACDSGHTRETVLSVGHLPVRTAIDGQPLPSIWSKNGHAEEYRVILPYVGESDQLAKGWPEARTAWWTMLQKIGKGSDIPSLVSCYVKAANRAAGAS